MVLLMVDTAIAHNANELHRLEHAYTGRIKVADQISLSSSCLVCDELLVVSHLLHALHRASSISRCSLVGRLPESLLDAPPRSLRVQLVDPRQCRISCMQRLLLAKISLATFLLYLIQLPISNPSPKRISSHQLASATIS